MLNTRTNKNVKQFQRITFKSNKTTFSSAKPTITVIIIIIIISINKLDGACTSSNLSGLFSLINGQCPPPGREPTLIGKCVGSLNSLDTALRD